MGADLYIPSVNNPLREKYWPIYQEAYAIRESSPENSPEREAAQKTIDEAFEKMVGKGYFRDPYNGIGIAPQLGFSWWRDVLPKLDENSLLQPPDIKELLNRIVNVPIKVKTKEELEAQFVKVNDDDHHPEAWVQYWEQQKKELVAFLGLALDLNEPIECSL